MELLKQLKEAQASGLSKEEYFHLLDMELKLNANKKQVPDSPVKTSDEVGEKALDTFFQNVYTKLVSQQQEENQKLQQKMMYLFEQQKNQLENQFKNLQQQLQQQQELQQRQLQQLQLQQQQEKEQVQQALQKEFKEKLQRMAQLHELSKQFYGANTRDVLSGQTVQQIKDEFHEMRSTVLNRLEEEKIFLRDALSNTQKDILALLSTSGKDVKRVKEILEANILAGLEKQTGQILTLCEDIIQTLTKKQEVHHRDVKKKENQAPGGRHSMFDPYNSDCFDSPF